ncbi:MAG TPA: hypothetical protein VGP13_01195 [Candidatus Paceibacterota bacterium]|jgi:hypothetical protein|nr:hypothetical protein [Candidatus Paceibacterota bacterium]
MQPNDIYTAATLSPFVLHVLLAVSLACALAGFVLVQEEWLEQFFLLIGLSRS